LPDCIFGKNQIIIETPHYSLSFSAESSLKYLNMTYVKNQKLN